MCEQAGKKSKNANRVDLFIWHLKVVGNLMQISQLFGVYTTCFLMYGTYVIKTSP